MTCERFPRGLKNVEELNPSDFNNLTYDGTVSAGRNGTNRPYTGKPNSYQTTPNGDHVFIFDGNGNIIYDISAKRVKAFKINNAPDGTSYFGDYKLKGSVPQFLLDLFGL